ncbi:hypothetical protein CMI37_26680 [Candidatus Pacearchaeota archaeon]|nr:hypothetical protein [Candidatus Pacearchaeota archaeon]|tara:strand:- start:2879 stop:3598 length:720 start_codon:yes stop_codon:yes gene_type:complete
MIIKKIFEGVFDEEVHSAFLKFSRGDFKNRYLVEVKKQAGGKWAIKTSAEFANFFVRTCLEKAPEEKIAMKGVIVSTLNIGNDDELGFEIKKRSNFQGIKKLQVDCEISPNKILDLMEKYPRVFFALSFSTPNCQLKIKPKAPKSGKPGKEGEGPKVDFCSLKTTNDDIVRELLFDVKLDGLSEAAVNHVVRVDEIVYPDNLESLKPEEIREQSKRKGVIVRNLVVEGQESVSEHEFVA